MKKVFLVCTMGAFLFSCGKSACDCKKEGEKLGAEMLTVAFSGDESKIKEMETKLEDLEEDCKDYSAEDFKACK